MTTLNSNYGKVKEWPGEGMIEMLIKEIDFLKEKIKKFRILTHAVETSIETIESHLDNGEYDQWLHLIIEDLKKAMKEAAI